MVLTPEFVTWINNNLSPQAINGYIAIAIGIVTVYSIWRNASKVKADNIGALWERIDKLDKKNEDLDKKNDELDAKLNGEIKRREKLHRRIFQLEGILREHNIPIPESEDTIPTPLPDTSERIAELEAALRSHGIKVPGEETTKDKPKYLFGLGMRK
jgi:DNA repair exonuclease SbcCD ATPase subunit